MKMPADKSEIGQAYQEGIDFQFLTAPVKIERADKKTARYLHQDGIDRSR